MPYMTAVEVRVQEAFREGFQEGLREGLREGIARQREQLCRQAARKFDAATASQLEALLEAIDNPDVFNKIGESIIDCESGGEFIDAVRV